MAKEVYDVYINGELAAENMDLEVALILTHALFVKYYNEPNFEVTVKRYAKGDDEHDA